MNNKYDAVIIGAGPSGLAAGPCTSVCKVGVPLCVGEGTNVAVAARFYLFR